ncbi:MAG: alpha-ribazole phosphatase [Clostridia bacterium]|nr:alpha-ribazole phosphatase [Clostridia bacterium]
MLELIFVRHGETDGNKKGTYLGWTDVDLNETGERQAQGAAYKLKDEKLDGMFSSPLRRCIATAEAINRHHNLNIELVEALKERNFGVWDNLTCAEIISKYPEEYNSWTADWINYCMRDGESSLDVLNRAAGFIDSLISRRKAGRFLLVSHLGCIRILVAYLLGMGIEGSWRFRIDNCGIARVTVNDEGYAYLTSFNA